MQNMLPLRVIIVSNQPTPYRREFFEALSARVQLRVFYLVPRERDRNWNVPLRPGEEVLSEAILPPGARLAARGGARLARRLRTLDADTLIIGGYDAAIPFAVSLAICRLRNWSFVLWSGTHGLSMARQSSLVRRVRRCYFRAPDGVATYSSRACTFAQHMGALHVAAIGNAHRDLRPYLPSRTLRPPSNRICKILYVGKVMGSKNLKTAETAITLFAEERNLHVEWHIAGRIMEPRLLTGQGYELVMHGPLEGPALGKLLAAADLLLHPSMSETWGLAIAEAMQCGLLVACDVRVGCVPDLAQDGETAIVGDMSTPEGVLAALSRFAGLTTHERDAILRRAVERAQAYNASAVAHRLATFMAELPTRRPRV